jgi:hypothetical protein
VRHVRCSPLTAEHRDSKSDASGQCTKSLRETLDLLRQWWKARPSRHDAQPLLQERWLFPGRTAGKPFPLARRRSRPSLLDPFMLSPPHRKFPRKLHGPIVLAIMLNSSCATPTAEIAAIQSPQA